nr:MAG TPA: hypothetical protein [Caudoviricetes sp.]
MSSYFSLLLKLDTAVLQVCLLPLGQNKSPARLLS